MKKLIIKFDYYDIVHNSNSIYRDKIIIITLEYDDISTERVIEECKKTILIGSTRFNSILDIKELTNKDKP